ncbi:MAG: DUF5780 domain-containing protein [Dethiobacteria bacterium]
MLIVLVFILLIIGCGPEDLATEESQLTSQAMITDEELIELQETITALEKENEKLREEIKQLTAEVEKKDSYEEPIVAETEILDEELVSVISTNILVQDTKHKTLYPDLVEIVIQNNSDETIRDYKVGMLAYDENGYPVKIEWSWDFSGGDYEKIGIAEDANVLPGKTYGKNKGWKLSDPHNIHYILACVYEATFYDGKTWKNPNYNNWRNSFIEKPLPEKYRN